jgi:hypothetical protein
VSHTHKKYCSDTCKELAEIARVDERVKEQAAERKATAKKGRISAEGKKRISEAQIARWAKHKKRKKTAKRRVE